MDLIDRKHCHLVIYKRMFYLNVFRVVFATEIRNTERLKMIYTDIENNPYRFGFRKNVRKEETLPCLNGTDWVLSLPFFNQTIAVTFSIKDK